MHGSLGAELRASSLVQTLAALPGRVGRERQRWSENLAALDGLERGQDPGGHFTKGAGTHLELGLTPRGAWRMGHKAEVFWL